MKIVLHGELASRFGEEHFIETSTPAEAIEGLSRQLEGWPRDMVLDVVGFGTEEALFSQTTEDTIHLMPRMYGGGGRWGTILIGAALIGLAVATGGISVLGMTISQGSLFLMGAGLVVMGVSQLFMKAPTVDKANDPPASKYLGINKNTAAIGTPIPLGYGRMKVAGHWLSLQSNSSAMVTTTFPANPS